MAEKKIVWMRAEDGDPQEREFSEAHSNALLKLEKERGIKNWRVLKHPTKDGKNPEFESD